MKTTIYIIIAVLILSPLGGCSRRSTCAQFANRKQALEAYRAGATYLDGNSNGIPCQNLK